MCLVGPSPIDLIVLIFISGPVELEITRSRISFCGIRNDAGSWFNAFSQGNEIFYTPAKPEIGYHKSLSAVVNVAAHEWAHTVTNNFSELEYQREMGALNEAFSDWFGIAVEQHYSTGKKSWAIGFANRPIRSIMITYLWFGRCIKNFIPLGKGIKPRASIISYSTKGYSRSRIQMVGGCQ
jgi:hypothetical protein